MKSIATDGAPKAIGPYSQAIADDRYLFASGQVPLDPPPTEAEIDAMFLSNGCLHHDWVASSCCNPALGPGDREGEECCYQICDSSVCCGRALVLGARTLVAPLEQRADWLATGASVAEPSSGELSAAERTRLAELWQADALMEHASIASFARFSLQLLALGAPARLVRDAQAAALDEVRHAEHAFSIASRVPTSGTDFMTSRFTFGTRRQ